MTLFGGNIYEAIGQKEILNAKYPSYKNTCNTSIIILGTLYSFWLYYIPLIDVFVFISQNLTPNIICTLIAIIIHLVISYTWCKNLVRTK